MPTKSLNRMLDDAKVRVEGAKNKWAVAYGPAAAVVLTCRRIKWEMLDATKVRTDEGEVLDLTRDPPIVVINKVCQAVQRWRWRKIETVMPQLAVNGTGRGAIMEPIWQLLNTKVKDPEWQAVHKGCLASAMAGRQYAQLRVQQCGWATHCKCIFCLYDIMVADGGGGESEGKTMRDPVVATPEQIEKAPEGDLIHRIYHCRKH